MTALVSMKMFDRSSARFRSDIAIDTSGLVSSSSVKRLKPGEALYVEGDDAPYCYQIIDGVMKEYNTLENGRRLVADFYGVGEILGFSDSDRHLLTAEAVTKCAVRFYPRDLHLRWIAARPDLSQRYIAALMTRLHRLRQHMIMLGRMSAAQRVAAFLLRLAHEQGTTSGVRLAMTRQDIADHLGLTIETVCRVLTAFKKSRLIEMKNAWLFDAPDIRALEAVSGIDLRH